MEEASALEPHYSIHQSSMQEIISESGIRRVSQLSLGPTTKKRNKPTPIQPIIQETPAEQEDSDDEELSADYALKANDGTQQEATQIINKKQSKGYLCTFRCAVTRAIYMELTKNSTARFFLLAY